MPPSPRARWPPKTDASTRRCSNPRQKGAAHLQRREPSQPGRTPGLHRRLWCPSAPSDYGPPPAPQPSRGLEQRLNWLRPRVCAKVELVSCHPKRKGGLIHPRALDPWTPAAGATAARKGAHRTHSAKALHQHGSSRKTMVPMPERLSRYSD